MTPSQTLTSKITPAQFTNAKNLVWAVASTVQEMGEAGAPEGIMYIAFQQKGIPIDVFQMITDVTVETGMCIRKQHCLFPGPNIAKAEAFKPGAGN